MSCQRCSASPHHPTFSFGCFFPTIAVLVQHGNCCTHSSPSMSTQMVTRVAADEQERSHSPAGGMDWDPLGSDKGR